MNATEPLTNPIIGLRRADKSGIANPFTILGGQD
jgi:hypothetical protein